MSTPQTRTTKAEAAQTITESKLSRIETIAREALDILGESAPDDLRRSAAEERARHESELRAIESRLEHAGAQISELGRQLTSAERLAEDRRIEAEEVWSLMGTQGASLAAAEQSLATARSELDLARVTADSRAREIDRLARHAASLSAEFADAANEIDTLRIELAETVEDRDEQRARSEELRTLSDAATARLESAVHSLEARLSALQAELAAARRSLDEAAAGEIESRDTIARLTERAASSEQQRDAHAADLTDAHAELADRRSELARLRREMADLSATLAERDRTIADMADTAAHTPGARVLVKDQPDAGIATAAPGTASDEGLSAQLDATRIEMDYLRQQLDRADDRAARFKERAESAESSLDKAAVLVRRARRRSAKRTEQYAGTVAAITAMRIRAENLEAERDAALAQSIKGLRLALGGGALGLVGILLAILV